MKFLILNGPNLNLLGRREPEIYGTMTYQGLEELICRACREAGVEVEIVQSNHEGAIVDAIQGAWSRVEGIIINPAAYTHTSIAILDALKAVCIPAVEVHLSDPDTREDFRRISYAGLACVHTIKGQGVEGYRQAILWLKSYLASK